MREPRGASRAGQGCRTGVVARRGSAPPAALGAVSRAPWQGGRRRGDGAGTAELEQTVACR